MRPATRGFLALAVLFSLISTPLAAADATCDSCANAALGEAQTCAVFALDGATVELTGGSQVDGNACIGADGELTMSGGTLVSGSASLASGAMSSSSGKATVGGGVMNDVDLSAQRDGALGAAADAAAQSCTQTFERLRGAQTISGTGGKNVICVGDVDLSGGARIILSGGTSDTFLLNVTGKFSLSGSSRIQVAGDLQPGGVLYNVEGTVYATSNVCLHRGGPLGQGLLEGHSVMCPWHAWSWDVRTGENTANPILRIPSYEVRVEGGDVLVRLPE